MLYDKKFSNPSRSSNPIQQIVDPSTFTRLKYLFYVSYMKV